MLELYRVHVKQIKQKTKLLIERKIGEKFELGVTKNGKPYVVGNPVYFSITHSGENAFIAISDKPVGIDYEIIRERKNSALLSRFTQREIEYISGSTEKFLRNWTAKEAYIKLIGGTIAHDLKRLEFYDGKLFFNGKEKPVYFEHISGGIYACCTEEEI